MFFYGFPTGNLSYPFGFLPKTWVIKDHDNLPDSEAHLIFHLHNYCKACTRPSPPAHHAFLARQRPRLSNCHPQFGYKGEIVLALNPLLKRRVYLFFALRTIFSSFLFFFFGCGGLTCNYYKMAREKDTQQAPSRHRAGSNKDSRRHLRSLETHFQVLGR